MKRKFECIACGTHYEFEEDAKMCPIMNDGFEEDDLETIESINDLSDLRMRMKMKGGKNEKGRSNN